MSFKKITIFRNWISTHKQESLVIFMALLYIAYFSLASIARYDNFYTGRYDLGNMDQVVWNTSQGRIFQISADNGEPISRLSVHADFILIFFAPLYKLWADPKILLFTQTLILALGAIFIFKFTNMITRSKNAAAVFSILYLLNPAIQYSNLYDFHAVTMATTFLLAAFYFFIKRRIFIFLTFAILAAITKEEIWLIVGLFGIYTLLFELIKLAKGKEIIKAKYTLLNIMFGATLTFISFSIFFLLVDVLMPNANQGMSHFALSYYSSFGSEPFSIIANIILSPIKVIETLAANGSITYLFQLFMPLGFLSIFSPIVLLFTLPDFGIDLLSNNGNLHQIYYQYSSSITPFIFIAAIFGFANLLKWFHKKYLSTVLLIFITATTLVSVYYFGPLPGARYANVDMFIKPLINKDVIQSYIEKIPSGAKVATTNNLGSHLSRREYIYTIPEGINKADVILFLLNDPYAQPSLAEQKKIALALEKNKNYRLILKDADFVVFQKENID